MLPLILPILLAGSLLGACSAGVTPRQMAMDQEIGYAMREQKLLFEKRMEFDQLAEDFLLTRDPVFLTKMTGTMERTEQDIDKARAFLGLQQPYHRGIARIRWQTAEEALQTGEQHLCEMLLIASELHLLYGDKTIAKDNLKKLEQRFPDAAFAQYREKAALLLNELETNPAEQDKCLSQR